MSNDTTEKTTLADEIMKDSARLAEKMKGMSDFGTHESDPFVLQVFERMAAERDFAKAVFACMGALVAECPAVRQAYLTFMLQEALKSASSEDLFAGITEGAPVH